MSTPDLVLVSHVLCPYVQRARIVLHEKGIPHRIEMIDLSNKPQWFLDKSPLGKVPLLLVDGEAVFESAVIAEYLDESSPGTLHPLDPLTRARNRSWIEFASGLLAAIATFYRAPDRPSFDAAAAVLRERLLRVEDTLAAEPYFNGPQFALVDAAFAPVFRYFELFDRYVDIVDCERTPALLRWRDALRVRESVRRAVVPDFAARLERFMLGRNSRLSDVMAASPAS